MGLPFHCALFQGAQVQLDLGFFSRKNLEVMARVQLEGVYKTFQGGVRALSGVDLIVESGERPFFGINLDGFV